MEAAEGVHDLTIHLWSSGQQSVISGQLQNWPLILFREIKRLNRFFVIVRASIELLFVAIELFNVAIQLLFVAIELLNIAIELLRVAVELLLVAVGILPKKCGNEFINASIG